MLKSHVIFTWSAIDRCQKKTSWCVRPWRRIRSTNASYG